MKFARKFAREISWSEIADSEDPVLSDFPTVTNGKTIYQITEKHYRFILFLQKKKPEPVMNNVSAPEDLSQTIVHEEEITNKEKLGSGQFGQVYRAKFRHQTVAVKILNVNPSDLSDAELRSVKLEVDILRYVTEKVEGEELANDC